MPPRLHPKIETKILELIRAAKSITEISAECIVCAMSVHRLAKKHGLTIAQGRRGFPPGQKRKPRAPSEAIRSTPIPEGQFNYRARAASLRWSTRSGRSDGGW